MAIDKSDYKHVFASLLTDTEAFLVIAQQHPDAFRRYLEGWIAVAEKAAEINNLALQDVILLFVEGCNAAFEKANGIAYLNAEQWQLLKKWADLVANYIDVPDDPQLASALLHCLKNPLLGIRLKIADELMLLGSFFAVMKELTENGKKNPAKQEDAGTAQLSIWEKLRILFKEVELNLQETFELQINTADSAYPEALKHYLESWQVVAKVMAAEDNLAISKFFHIVLLFIDFNNQLFNQVDGLNYAQQALLRQWHSLFNHYINAQGGQPLVLALVKCLKNPAWIHPLESTSEKALLFELGVVDVPASQLCTQQPVSTAISESISVWKQLVNPFKAAFLNLKIIVAEQEQRNKPASAEYLQGYQQSWQKIAAIIESDTQQAGLLDVVLLFTEITSTAFEKPGLSKPQLTRLKKWHTLFDNYVKGQGDKQFIGPLIKCLSDPIWPAAITAEDEQLLLSGFDEVQNQLSRFSSTAYATAESSQFDAAHTDKLLLPQTTQQLATSAPIINYENQQNQNPLTTTKVALWQELLEPLFNQAAAFLQIVADGENVNDAAAFKRGFQAYVEHWQAIADIVANDENLTGLFDVVLLFTEQAKQVLAQQDSLSSEQFALLNTWQTSFLAYFKHQNNAPFAWELVKCLRNPFWSDLITAEDESLLLHGLGIHDTDQVELPVGTHPVWQKFDVFFADTLTQIQLMQALLAANNSQNCREYLQQYSDDWAVIAEIIAEEDEKLQTLADICLLFSDNCKELIEQNIALHSDHIQLLQNWQTAFIAFLQNPTVIPQQVSRLIECLENHHWLHPLTSEDKKLLLEMMQDDSLKSAMFAEEFNDHQESTDFIVSRETKRPEEVAMFSDESLQANVEEDLILLFSEGLAEDDLEQLIATESEQVAMFSDESSEANVEQDFTLLSEESIVDSEQPELAADSAETKNSHEFSSDALSSPPLPPSVNLTDVSASLNQEVTAELLSNEHAMAVNPELIAMLGDEFSLLTKDLNAELLTVADTPTFKKVLKNYEFKFENLAVACDSIGLLGLAQVFGLLSVNLCRDSESDSINESDIKLIKTTLSLIQDYLATITDRDKSIALASHLSAQGWQKPLTNLEKKTLADLLAQIVICSHNPALEHQKSVAEPSDVSLELAEDVNHELLDSLLTELPVLTGSLSTVIQKIISDTANVEQLLEARRIAHTLKGLGNIVGVAGIAAVTHHLEEILEYLSEHKALPTQALAEVLLEAADCLEMMSDALLKGQIQPPTQALQVLQDLLDWANQIAATGLSFADTELDTRTLLAQPTLGVAPAVQNAKTAEAVAMMRVPSEVIDDLLRMTDEDSILNEQLKERVKCVSDELETLNELSWHIQSLVTDLDEAIDIKSYSVEASPSKVDIEFDALEMQQYNELHTATTRIAEVATDIRAINIHLEEQLVELKYLMLEEESLQKQNQIMLQSIRMVPVNTIASRCQLIVRQACRATHKQVELEIKGANVLIDSGVLNEMAEPLMHLLRNCIDHGIEPLDLREKHNKPKVGKITLAFSRQGHCVVIRCQDDGAGLAHDDILQTAIKKGLISANQHLTDAEIHRLILMPGFSTRTFVTQTSGRGIGMDAIQTKVSTLHGQMSLHSVSGKGLTIEITIPLTLSSMPSLLIKCGGQTMAISNRGLKKIHHADECLLVQEDAVLYCDIDDNCYPAAYFAALVGMPVSYSKEQKLPALQIEDEANRTHIIWVDELLSYRDLLVKNMGDYIPPIQGISGASILANGAVVPIIDLVEMLHYAVKYNDLLSDAC